MIIDLPEFLTLRNQLPIVDVRSEGEHAQGHIRPALNIPILNDQERVVVGTLYKKEGQQAAIKAGFRLVGPRLVDIIENAQVAGKELLIHCWRGGMRSANFCQFVGMAGIKTHQLRGGYKAYRQQAMASLQHPFKFVIISGCTGSGKSELLRTLKSKGEQIIDLEFLASHKGSVFGGINMPPQPTTEQFQNDLFEAINRLDLSRRIWVEDESIAIGKIFLPHDLWRQMGTGPVIEVEVSREKRIERLVGEYHQVDPKIFNEAMQGIQKKLGGQHFKTAQEKVLQHDFFAAIDVLLTYYDKAYNNGLQRKASRIKARLKWDDNMSVNEFGDYMIDNVKGELV